VASKSTHAATPIEPSAHAAVQLRGLTPAKEEDTSEAAGGDVDQFTKLTDQSAFLEITPPIALFLFLWPQVWLL
jgi:hypothetical protein